jgi:probable rRNA maturation factor
MRSRTRTGRPRPRSHRPQVAPAIDIKVDSPLWKTRRGVKAVLQRAICEAAAMAATSGGELAIVLTDDSAIRALNRDWRGQDRPTNVLSFPANCPSPSLPRKRAGRACGGARSERAGDRGRVRLLGDIVIAYETMAREALAERRPFAHHLAHLAVHGFLHLVGHDHAADADADAMEALEIAVLARLDVPNPYLLRAED